MAMSSWDGSWSKPRDEGTRTRYLLVGNVGKNCGVTDEDLFKFLEPFGGLECIQRPRAPTHGRQSRVHKKRLEKMRKKEKKARERERLNGIKEGEGDDTRNKVEEEVVADGSGSDSVASAEECYTHMFAVFKTVEDAARVKDHCDLKECEALGGRKLFLQYSLYHPPKAPSKKEVENEVQTQAASLGIQGLHMFQDFITEAEETELLKQLGETGGWQSLARRRVKHFGFEFDYSIRGVNPEKEITPFPEYVEPFVERIGSLEVINQTFDQITVNEYPAGIGISPHIDTHSPFVEDILSLSLGSSAVMEFRQGEDHRKLLIPRRALLVMSGESRFAWQHYIPHRKTDRVGGDILKRSQRTSLTFRTIRKEGGCGCSYPQYCDTQGATLPPTRMLLKNQGSQAEDLVEKAQKFPEMERDHVHDVYDHIATHFSSTRFAIWPEVKTFLDSMPPYSLVGDIGCGNGKYFQAGKHCCMVGGDLSLQLVDLCKSRGHDVVQLDVVRPPYRQNLFDGVISIAVIHHMSTFERRLAAMTSLVNLLRPGGLALVTVWAMEQEESKKMKKWKELEHRDHDKDVPVLGKDYLVPWNVPFHRPEAAKAASESGEIDEKKGTVVFQRFYHVFQEGELECLVNYIPNITVVRCVFDRSNWCITVRRDY